MKNLRNTLWALVGLFGLATLVAAPVAADQVILDDLIVDGSICAGFDCVNGESFGFDTLRLKENNLRVRFQDTSNSASFPTFDWTLVANDTNNGGRNRFTIECTEQGRESFTIEGCAPSNSLYVRSNGNVGFGTATPVVDLHVVSGNTPTLRLEQDGSSGFGAQTWDVAGNEANFFIRDASNGSTLPFRIFPGAPSNALAIEATGDIGIGTTSPDGRVHITDRNGDARIVIESSTDAGDFAEFTFREDATDQWGFGRFGNADQFYVFNYQQTLYGMAIDADNNFGMGCLVSNNHDLTINSGNTSCLAGTFSQIDAGETAFVASSSRTIKQNLEPVAVDGLLDKIAEVPVYTYDFIEGKKGAIGLMAEDFHQIFGRGSDKLLSGHEMQVALWLAVQELTAQNRELTERLAAIEAAKE